MSGQATSAMLPRASAERQASQARVKRNAAASESQTSEKRAKRQTSAEQKASQATNERRSSSERQASQATSAMLPQASEERNASASGRRAKSEPSVKRAQSVKRALSEKRAHYQAQKNRPRNEVGFRLYVSSNYSASVSATTVKATLAWISLYNLTTAVYSPSSLASFITMLLRSTSRPNLANSSATWMLLTEP